MSTRKRPEELRSHRWLGVSDLRSFGHRSRLRQVGYDTTDWAGRPVIGIINTWSDINPCHTHLRQRAEEVKRGVLQAGGFPIELPAMSLAEVMVKPTTMLYRNFLAMETEELLRSHPIDGAVLLGGCDKTTPGLVMGAISMGLPTIFVPAGPMLRGNWQGKYLGSGSDVWKYWDEKRAGKISEAEWDEIENGIARSFGTCMTMGTAATMMAIAEAMGLSLPGASSIPAADSNHPRMATQSGRRIVEMVWEDLTTERVLGQSSFENAIKVHMAMGGSTNAIIHVVAMAKRAGVQISLADFDRISRKVPVIANVRPSGAFLMEDFFYAGGLRALMTELRDLLDLRAMTVTGKTVADNIAGAKVHLPDVIHSTSNPISTEPATGVLYGNLAPRGAIIKPSAVEKRLLKHRGPALAFEDYNHMACDDRPRRSRRHGGPRAGAEELGPEGRPRHARVGHDADPDQAGEAGRARHAARLRCAHERHELRRLRAARVAGELCRRPARLREDRRSDRGRRRGAHHQSDDLRRGDGETQGRVGAPSPRYERGYGAMFSAHIGQADEGCDFDFLSAHVPVPEPEIH